jgi:putative ABC transport system permease protein
MMRFILKGILRDRARSVFPFLIVLAGSFLTVLLFCYIKSLNTDVIKYNANLRHGYVKVMTKAYAKEVDQVPNDLALMNVSALIKDLQAEFPGYFWTRRIQFGGLLDIPDEKGETKTQAPVVGTAADILTPSSPETKLLELQKVIVRGRIPQKPGEILLSDELARKLGVLPGEKATLISSTMHGSMSMTNFVIAGTIRFGIRAMDRMGVIADLADIQNALDMEDAAGEILGFAEDLLYRHEKTVAMAKAFNARFQGQTDEFLPVMQTLREQPGMEWMFIGLKYLTSIVIGIFMLAMSLVLWNASLIGSLRRYGEIGVRLAIGENKAHVYQSMIYESLMIGVLGSAAGTVLGLAVSYYIQVKGIDISGMMRNITFFMPTVVRSQITPFAFVIGFIPGLLATFAGTAIAGLRIFKRQTAQLFKELEI